MNNAGFDLGRLLHDRGGTALFRRRRQRSPLAARRFKGKSGYHVPALAALAYAKSG